MSAHCTAFPSIKQRYGLLEASNSTKRFWREADFRAEELNEPSLGHSDLVDHVCDAALAMPKSLKCVIDRRMPLVGSLQLPL